MDLQELKTKHPELYSQVYKIGADEVRSQIKGLLSFIDDDKQTVIQAINEGKTIRDDEVFAKLTRAKMNSNAIQAMENNNPPEITPKEPVHAPESEITGNQPNNEPTEEQKINAMAEDILKNVSI